MVSTCQVPLLSASYKNVEYAHSQHHAHEEREGDAQKTKECSCGVIVYREARKRGESLVTSEIEAQKRKKVHASLDMCFRRQCAEGRKKTLRSNKQHCTHPFFFPPTAFRLSIQDRPYIRLTFHLGWGVPKVNQKTRWSCLTNRNCGTEMKCRYEKASID